MHYAGVGCEMEAIMEIAGRHGIPVVEDNAHGLFGSYRGKALGTFGALATQSFHETKNISCGEGGALVINDSALVERAKIIREKGTNRNRSRRDIVTPAGYRGRETNPTSLGGRDQPKSISGGEIAGIRLSTLGDRLSVHEPLPWKLKRIGLSVSSDFRPLFANAEDSREKGTATSVVV